MSDCQAVEQLIDSALKVGVIAVSLACAFIGGFYAARRKP